MARTGRPKVELVLTADEREALERWARRAASAQASALPCRVVLACADDLSNVEVGAPLSVHRTMAWCGLWSGGQVDDVPSSTAARSWTTS